MEARQLDRLARTLAESRGRRSLIAAIAGLAMGAAKTPIADAASGTCTRWVIAAGSSPFDKFQHVDDDFLVEVRPKGGGGWSEVFFDNTGEDGGTWERVKGVMPGARADIRPTYMRQFERMVVAHQAYRARANAAALAEAARTARPSRTRRTRAKGR